MSPVKDFDLTYQAPNDEDIFCKGDTVAGKVSFSLTKQTTVKSLFVKFKADARVHWTEGSGDDERSYSDHRRYFKFKEYLVAENVKGSALPPGIHHFKFRFKIPHEDLPSSFKGKCGSVAYTLEAKLSRSWRWPSVAQKEINFASNSFPNCGQVMCPQTGSVNKEMGGFSKGQVQMSATINRKVVSPGDTVSVVVQIRNASSKTTRLKFGLQRKVVYRAGSSRTTSEKNLCKHVGDAIPLDSEETVSCQLQIPANVAYTLHNCEILTVEYYLKVYLDIKFAFDPEVVFPLIIVPSAFAPRHPGEAEGLYPAGAVGAPSYSDFPSPAFPIGPYPAPAGPGAYGYPASDPAQPLNTMAGYNNPWPQQAAPYGFPTAAMPPSSVQHQGPTAPPLYQQGDELPSYTSLFPTSHDTFSGTGSVPKS